MSLVFYVADTETNGLMPTYHEITELSVIRVADRKQLYRKLKCEYPQRANLDSLRITGKTIEDLKVGSDKFEVIKECEKFFNEDGLTPNHRCLILHNASFDRKFLQAMWARYEKVFPVNLYLDTISLMKLYIKQNELGKLKTNLDASCNLLGIKKTGSDHNARDDARNTYFLYQELMKKELNYLPLIKTSIHSIGGPSEEELDLLNE
jgi:DNA polymerase III epsilon subunit-like protein